MEKRYDASYPIDSISENLQSICSDSSGSGSAASSKEKNTMTHMVGLWVNGSLALLSYCSVKALVHFPDLITELCCHGNFVHLWQGLWKGVDASCLGFLSSFFILSHYIIHIREHNSQDAKKMNRNRLYMYCHCWGSPSLLILHRELIFKNCSIKVDPQKWHLILSKELYSEKEVGGDSRCSLGPGWAPLIKIWHISTSF